MNITRESNKVKAVKWARYQYNLTTNLGENGARLTGSKEHIELSRKTSTEGMVLLENNGTLPLKEGTTVALFGIGSLDYVPGGGGSGRVYSEYVRNIYVGYRYFETIPGASEKVNYPFGYGLSYTDFEISKPVAKLISDQIEITVNVKNIGNMAGKEVVQIYYSAPQGVLGKSKISLAGFQKTKLLAPGETETCTITFAVDSMASYDDLGKLQMSAYVLEKGEYIFYAGNNCRNLTAADYRYEVKEAFIVTEQLTQKCAPNKLPKRMLADGSFEALPSFPIVKPVVPSPASTETIVEPDTPYTLMDVANGVISLDAFMTQLTNDELIHLMSGIPNQGLADTNGWGGIPRLGIPAVMTTDGPAGVRSFPKMGAPATAWPCATLIACTWNTDLMYEIGRAGGFEAKEKGMIRKDYFREFPKTPFVRFEDTVQALATFYEVIKNQTLSPLMRKAKMLELIDMLIHDNFSTTYEKNDTSYPVENAVKDYLDAGQGMSLDLEDIAKQFDYSKYYLDRRFKDTFGISLIAYRNNKRMELAKELLTEKSVSDVSETLGFSSIYVFSRAFKNHYGVAPTKM